MSALLFRLRNVPDDEADDIRALLEKQHVDYYETTAGNWGISMPGIWVEDDTDLERARKLIDVYQQQRHRNLRAEYTQRQAQGLEPSLLEGLARRPLLTLAVLAFCLFILYVTINPFLQLINFRT